MQGLIMEVQHSSLPFYQNQVINSSKQIKIISEFLNINIEALSHEEAVDACFYKIYDLCKEKKWNILKPLKNEIDHFVNSIGQSLLNLCIVQKEKELFTGLIEQKISLHRTGIEGNLPLHNAAERGYFKFTSILAEYNEIDQGNRFDQTPLHLAANGGHLKIVKFLVTEYPGLCRRHAKWPFGSTLLELTPLALSVIKGHVDCARFILEKEPLTAGSHIKIIGNLLHLSIFFHQNEVLELLLNQFHNVFASKLNEPNDRGQTPLMLAAYVGNDKAVYLLNKKNALLDATDGNGNTALHYAVRGNHRNVILLLIQYGADARILNKDKLEPYTLAKSLIDQYGDEMRTIAALINNVHLKKSTVSDILNYAEFPPENLALQGGGPKGLGLIGALEVLNLDAFKRISGTSAGAITAPFVALGFTIQEIKEIVQGINFMDILDLPINYDALKPTFENTVNTLKALFEACTNPVGAGIKVIKKCLHKVWKTTGIFEGEFIRKEIEKHICKKTGIHLFTFKDLREHINQGFPYKDLYLFATLIGVSPQILEMHSEQTEDNIWDDVPLSDAARGSLSIPFVFKPFQIHIRVDGERRPHPKNLVVVDGGLLNNLPIERFDRKKYTTSNFSQDDQNFPMFNKRTIGISFSLPKDEKPKGPIEPGNIKDFMFKMIQIYYDAESLIRNLNPYAHRRIIKIDPLDVGLLSFNMNDEMKVKLMDSGKIAALTFFKKQKEDFFNYTEKEAIINKICLQDSIGNVPGFYLYQNEKWIKCEINKGKAIHLNELLASMSLFDYYKDHPIKIAFCACEYFMTVVIDENGDLKSKLHANALEKGKAETFEILATCQDLKFEIK